MSCRSKHLVGVSWFIIIIIIPAAARNFYVALSRERQVDMHPYSIQTNTLLISLRYRLHTHFSKSFVHETSSLLISSQHTFVAVERTCNTVVAVASEPEYQSHQTESAGTRRVPSFQLGRREDQTRASA